MARPSTPLISRDEVAATALRMIDAEGVEGLSVRQLAAELGVNNKSLYHHFADRNAIIASAAELALSGIGVPISGERPWGEWLVRAAHLYRDALLAHPALIPVMLARGRFNFGLAWFDEIVRELDGQGVPTAATIAFIEAIESFAIGNVLCKTAAATGAPQAVEVAERYEHLARALSHRTLKYDQQFAIGCRHLIEGVAATFGLDPELSEPPGPPGQGHPPRAVRK